jgi:hypothetical protein
MPRPLDIAVDVPWIDLVRFHRSIVQRAEEGFWALDARDANSERWTSLEGFAPNDLEGPWPVAPDTMVSTAWRQQLQQKRIDTMYLGGPCFVGKAKVGTEHTDHWRPLLYREVQVVACENGLEIRPVADSWLLSPPVHQLLDRLQLRLDREPEELSAQVMEAAQASLERERGTVGRAVANALLGLAPELRPEFQRGMAEVFATPPSSWVLFAPPTRIGPFNRHLVRDYRLMERMLEVGATEAAGGLGLLRPSGEPVVESHAEVLPFTPQNGAQERAVAAMLAGRPVTVVSGPPGCGKSQVVVSLLLNAWARGQSVLFASNNNKAVDVVRQRLTPFEADQPIAIRAGDSAKNNVASVLRRIMQAAGSHAGLLAGIDVEGARRRRVELRAEQRRLREDLDAGIPQRTAEALESALGTYGQFRRIAADVEARLASLMQRLGEIVGREATPDETAHVAEETRAWLSHAATLQAALNVDGQDRARHDAEVARLAPLAAAALALCALPPEALDDETARADVSVLLEVLSTWSTCADAIFTRGNAEALRPEAWNPSHDRWASADIAAVAAAAVDTIARRVSVTLASAPRVVGDCSAARRAHAERWNALLERGWPAHVQEVKVDRDRLQAWLALWAEFIAMPVRTFDPRTILARRRIRSGLSEIEHHLRQSLPLEVWRRVGALDEHGRDRLAELLERMLRCVEAQERLEPATRAESELEAALIALRSEAGVYGAEGPTHVLALMEWDDALDALRRYADHARVAAVAGTERTERDRLTRGVRALAEEWDEVARGTALLSAWRQGVGAELDMRLGSLRQAVVPETVAEIAALLAGQVIRDLLAALGAARAQHEERLAAAVRRDAVPTEAQRIAAAWAARPDVALTVEGDANAWPNEAAYLARLASLAEWMSAWRHFSVVERPQQTSHADLEHSIAVGRLREATELLPAGSEAEGLRTRVTQVLEGPAATWPVGELRDRFAAFMPERLRLRLDTRLPKRVRRGPGNSGPMWRRSMRSASSGRSRATMDRASSPAMRNCSARRFGSRQSGSRRRRTPVLFLWLRISSTSW